MGEVRGRGMTVDKALANFVIWRSYIIKGFIEDNLFRETIVVEKQSEEKETHELDRSIKLWQVKLDDELLALLPPSTMPLNFNFRVTTHRNWLFNLSLSGGAWLESIALNSDGLCKADRLLLFKEINKLTPICEVCSIVAYMKEANAKYPTAGDEDVVCYACPVVASCVYWFWCGTCKEDIFRKHCNSCNTNRIANCESCGGVCTTFARCSDNFEFHYLS